MKYMTFIRHDEKHREQGPPPGLLEAMGKLVEDGFAKGWLVDAGGLKPSKEGAIVRLSRGKIKVTDGPFTEAKEVIGGYAIIDAPSHDEALRLAKEFMELHRTHWPEFEGESEVRPMFGPNEGP